eukprot:3909760-Pleurochrysis_carterae.AAC.1
MVDAVVAPPGRSRPTARQAGSLAIKTYCYLLSTWHAPPFLPHSPLWPATLRNHLWRPAASLACAS